MNIDKLASWLLKGMMGLIVVVFALFLLVGYDRPYEENPNMNNPLLTDAVLILSFALVIACIGVTIWSAVQKIIQGSSTTRENGLIGRTGLVSVIILAASVVIGLIVGFANSGETLLINGESWNNATEIVITDTAIISIAILLIVTIAALVYSMFAKVKK